MAITLATCQRRPKYLYQRLNGLSDGKNGDKHPFHELKPDTILFQNPNAFDSVNQIIPEMLQEVGGTSASVGDNTWQSTELYMENTIASHATYDDYQAFPQEWYWPQEQPTPPLSSSSSSSSSSVDSLYLQDPMASYYPLTPTDAPEHYVDPNTVAPSNTSVFDWGGNNYNEFISSHDPLLPVETLPLPEMLQWEARASSAQIPPQTLPVRALKGVEKKFKHTTPSDLQARADAAEAKHGQPKSRASRKPRASKASPRASQTKNSDIIIPAHLPLEVLLPHPSSTPDELLLPKDADPALPPRPPNSFILFRTAFCKKIKIEKIELPRHSVVPGEQKQIETSKFVGVLWKMAPEEYRKEWHYRAERAKVLHEQRYPGYVYKPRPSKKTATT